MGTFASAHVDSPRGRLQARWAPWLFYLCVTAAFYFKWLIGPVLILSGCLAYVAVKRDWRGLRFLLNPLGIGLFLVSSVGWFLAAYREYPQILQDQLTNHFGRFQGEMGGATNPFFYCYSVLLITLPWTPLVVWGAVRGSRLAPQAVPWLKFAACWMAPGFVLLSLSRFKHAHYAAPLMVPFTAVAALGLLAYLRSRLHASGRSHVLLVAASVAGCVAGAAVVWRLRLPDGEKHIILALVAIGAAGSVAVPYFQFRRWSSAATGALFALAWLLIAGVFGLVMPHHDSYRDQTELAARVNQAVPAHEVLHLVQMPAKENQITFYLRPDLRRYDRVEEFTDTLPAETGGLLVLAPVEIEEQLSQSGRLEQLDAAPVGGKRPANERLVLYRLHPSIATTGRGGIRR
jgi:4-amino-4-deoxy-L-arabinose transferase-like glycosyltransferase